MAETNLGRARDLVLAPGEYAYVLDTTKGLVNVSVGPYKNSMSDTDQPVLWDNKTLRYRRCSLDESIHTNPIAPEGFYLALYNPAKSEDGAHPRDGSSTGTATLNVGHRVNIAGPAQFPLWFGQMVEVIRGHHLRSNQYLLAQVYNDVEASANWQQAVVKPQGEGATTIAPTAFAPGQTMVIKGTDVAFFIPPTGIKVVAEDGEYVREAVTLERLEYCILLDEDGNKRFMQGPAVVFPEPTEHFVIKEEARKFKAIELNPHTGIYVKVTANYQDATGTHTAGDELFITGAEQAIYFQREEHSVIRYGGQTKHYAVAVPLGEGRYVLDRNTGDVRLVRGPQMLLCDPRKEVIVRRVLDDTTVALWYPGNSKAAQVNRELAALTASLTAGQTTLSQYEGARAVQSMTANVMAMTETQRASSSPASKTSRQIAGDQFQRGETFTPPRTITLDTKYEGAVAIALWPGYAVMVGNKTGARRVAEGPATLLLEYDETLAPLELSMGTPKHDAQTLKTVYLRVQNNTVSDKITVETADLVRVDLTLAYRVNFEGPSEQWFAVENYVRLLCDHMRSLVRNMAKRTAIADFYGNTIDLVRDALLGAATPTGRPGRLFVENGMRVYDVEVLDVAIKDTNVSALLGGAQKDALVGALALAKAERELEQTRRTETIHRAILTIQTETVAALLQAQLAKTNAEADVETARLTREQAKQDILNDLTQSDIDRKAAVAADALAAKSAIVDLDLRKLLGETEELVKRAAAVDANMAVALTTFADSALTEKIVTTLAPMAAMSGVSAADILSQLFKGTPLEAGLKALGTRARLPVGQDA